MVKRCQLCDQPASRVVECGGIACRATVGPCCLTVDGLCTECAAEEARDAAWLRQCSERDVAELAALLLSGAIICGERMPRVGEGRSC